MSAFVTFKDVNKVYQTGEVEIPALHDVNFTIEKGEFCEWQRKEKIVETQSFALYKKTHYNTLSVLPQLESTWCWIWTASMVL